MNAAIIGMGSRASSYVRMIAEDRYKHFVLTAICDLAPEKMQWYLDHYYTDKPESQKPRSYTEYQRILEDKSIDFVFITTNDTTHCEIALACLRAGKHILLEKPLATTLDDCLALYQASKAANRIVRLGFCLRYATFYEKMQEIVDSGMLGEIVSIEAKETLSFVHGASFMRRWHRFKKNNGGFLNAKCSHDLDILNRLAKSDPKLVSAFGGRRFFNPLDGAADRCEACQLAETCPYFLDQRTIPAISPEEAICPFNAEKDIVDHEVVNILYQNGITASFTVSMLSAEANRTTHVFGTLGTMSCDLAKSTITVRYLHTPNVHTYTMSDTAGGHGGGDERLYRSLVNLAESGSVANDARQGLFSTAIALAGEASMENRSVVDLEQWLSGLA